MKIAIVGAEESKWTEEQKKCAKNKICSILSKYTDSKLYFSNITVVSGHCPKGGIDIWTEEIAKELGTETLIFPAEVNQWEDEMPWTKDGTYIKGGLHLKGYKSRNIQIAENCDILYCIVPQTYIPRPHEDVLTDLPSDIYCWHCGELGHPRNGGCWTMKYAAKLGKETYLVVIE